MSSLDGFSIFSGIIHFFHIIEIRIHPINSRRRNIDRNSVRIDYFTGHDGFAALAVQRATLQSRCRMTPLCKKHHTENSIHCKLTIRTKRVTITKDNHPLVGSRAMPLGLLISVSNRMSHASNVLLHMTMTSRESSSKYQFPDTQSSAIWWIAEISKILSWWIEDFYEDRTHSPSRRTSKLAWAIWRWNRQRSNNSTMISSIYYGYNKRIWKKNSFNISKKRVMHFKHLPISKVEF